jgi:DNA recombination protein RmuC
MSRETLTIYLLAGALAAALLILLIALLRRRLRGARGTAPDLLDLVSRRLEQLEGLTRDVEALSKVLLVPHARGGFGETLLNELLRNWLPEKSYELQYTFSNGARVDAVIRLGDFLVPVDAKFPLESVRRSMEDTNSDSVVTAEVRRAFQRHIEAISSKYIRPEDGTLQFGLMYIPSERVYYHSFVESDSGLLEEALRSGVVPVSPGGLFLYLQTVAYGLRGLAFSRRQREIIQMTLNLRREVGALKKLFDTGNTHLRNLAKSRDDAGRKLEDIDAIVDRLDTGDEHR